MIMDEIRDIAERFVDAVEEAKSEFSIKERMHRFPKGCGRFGAYSTSELRRM